MADSAEGRAVHFPALTERIARRVKATLGPLVAVANPLDYHTFIWNNEPAHDATPSPPWSSGGFDLNMLVLDFPARRPLLGCRLVADGRRLRGGAEDQQARAARSSPRLAENLPEDHAERAVCAAASCRLHGIAEAFDAAEAAAFIGAALAGGRLQRRSLRLDTRTVVGQGLPWTRPRPRRGWLPPGCRCRPDGGSATRRGGGSRRGARLSGGGQSAWDWRTNRNRRGPPQSCATATVSGRQREALGTLGQRPLCRAHGPRRQSPS